MRDEPLRTSAGKAIGAPEIFFNVQFLKLMGQSNPLFVFSNHKNIINPLSPSGDQHLISPYHVTACHLSQENKGNNHQMQRLDF